MKTKNILGILAMATLITASSVFAQEGMMNANVSAQADMNAQPPRGFMGQIRNIFGGERREARQEFQDDRNEAMGELKDDMMQRKEWRMASTTPGSATPTPWKNFKENMKEARGDFKDNMKEMRGEIMGKMATLTDAQVVAISTKLGITADSLKAQIASGTPLRQIIGNKIAPEDMMQILPKPMMASGTFATSTRPRMFDEKPRGFFNSIRERLLGSENRMEEGGNVNADVNAQADITANPGIRNFFKRLFNF